MENKENSGNYLKIIVRDAKNSSKNVRLPLDVKNQGFLSTQDLQSTCSRERKSCCSQGIMLNLQCPLLEYFFHYI